MLNKELQGRVDTITKKLNDEGKLIEGGFASYMLVAMHPDCPTDQIRETRLAFFAGAQHLWGSIMTVMDEDREPTPSDLRRMDLIQRELDTFIKEFSKTLPTKGSA